MSLPPELRILCLRLTSTPPKDLPNLTPTLVQYVLQCQIPLSNPSVNSGKADASQSAVLVHKLKTQLTTLLNCKNAEGRFAAIVLIKVVIEVGGWEILRDAGSWVRGMLSVLGKPDSSATKELCIVALTKIYCMTHQYQTLVREITTPTLPTFVTSCLNLISSKPSLDMSSSIVETVFQSFTMLLPRHTTIFRPFASQLRAVTRPYLACTLCDKGHVSLSVKDGARKLVVVLHQTVAKNGGGEEWGKAVRDLVQDIHVTADQVFRAVVEDWESTAGYIAEPVNVNEELSGGARTPEDLSRWTGIMLALKVRMRILYFTAPYPPLSLFDPNVVAAASSFYCIVYQIFLRAISTYRCVLSSNALLFLDANKEAMLASILNPFVGKNGKALASVLPHITRTFPNDDVVEILLRPRMPTIPSRHNYAALNDLTEDLDAEDDIMETIDEEAITSKTGNDTDVQKISQLAAETETRSPLEESSTRLCSHSGFSTINNHTGIEGCAPLPSQRFTETQPLDQRTINTDTVMSY
ncbi:hypothetical protein DID88_000764 [Monilinia fructigena]|uniref:Pre-rRNA-processing protein RIX1 n=1 Tax=Monilinia fructigena TaxID=38457 RepID=A0A395IP41_9HELO|nr:hypothetical protein DID88_000764 [Monilinia fructigena]